MGKHSQLSEKLQKFSPSNVLPYTVNGVDYKASIYGSCYRSWHKELRQKSVNLHVLRDLTA